MFFLLVRVDYIISFFTFGLLTSLLINLFSYINKTNRDFTNFLTSFVHNDFTIHYSAKNKGKSFDKLYQTFELIQAQLRSLNFEKEIINQHLQNLVEHMDVGVISLDKDQNIQLLNKAFRQMFNTPALSRGQHISKVSIELSNIVHQLRPDEKRLTKLKISSSLQQLIIHSSVYKLKGQEFKLISLKNIHGELDEREMESYQKLIRVLTHEIMNTLSPIISLSGTINQSVKDLVKEQTPLDDKTGNYLNEGIEAIQDRSQGLLKFTEEYRKLMRLPQPKLKLVDINEYFKKFRLLFEQQIKDKNIEFTFEYSEDIQHLNIDSELFEQLLINVYKNAIESFDQIEQTSHSVYKPTLRSTIHKNEEGFITITISDNGCGMDNEMQEKAFIPFFTTKEKGSGIGLSLSKQIVLLHKGRMHCDSKVGKGTKISILLNP